MAPRCEVIESAQQGVDRVERVVRVEELRVTTVAMRGQRRADEVVRLTNIPVESACLLD
jgi:hypothetical protein